MNWSRSNAIANWARTLQGRIVLFFVGLILLIQTGAYFAMDRARQNVAREEVERQLDVGIRVFQRVMGQDRRQFEQATAALAVDAEFQRVLGDKRFDASALALQPFSERLGATTLQLVANDGSLLGAAPSLGRAGDPFPRAALLERSRIEGKASAVELLADGRPYQLVAVPVHGSGRVAWLVAGYLLGEPRARGIEALTELRIAFWRRSGREDWTLVAATFEPNEHWPLANAMHAALPRTAKGKFASTLYVDVSGRPYQSRVVPLSQDETGPVVVASLHRSIEVSLQPFEALGRMFLALGALAVLLFAAGGWLIAGEISRPVNDLVRVADRMRAGDYSAAPPIESSGEIARLAESIDHMRSAIAEREARILRFAFNDELTGLANRAGLIDRLVPALQLAQAMRQPVAVAVMNLDRFNSINDVLGFDFGDRILREVGQRLNALYGARGTLARLGADEFALFIANATPEMTVEACRELARSLEHPIHIDQHAIDVAMSVGVAGFPEHGDNPETLLHGASVAMYSAKRARAGITVFDPSQVQAKENQLSMLSALRRAIQQGELELYYQPKVDVATERLTGAEALVRWIHPERGSIAPYEFVPFLEQTGHIRELTRWALAEVTQQTAQWFRAGRRMVVSVNISVRDLLDASLPQTVADLLATHALPASCLCLELTESAFMEDPDSALATARRLNEIGVRLAIDDYGTGYSSLSYIQQLPVQEMKIDRTFLRGLVGSRDNRKIVRSTVELGRSLGLDVTAEGVEDRAALEVLRKMGCKTAQGYLFAKPLGVADFEQWIDAHFVSRIGERRAATGSTAAA